MGATKANFGKTILKPTAMNSSLIPDVAKIEPQDTYRDDEKQESTLVNLNATDGTFKNPKDHFNGLKQEGGDHNDSTHAKNTKPPTPTPNQ